MAARNRARLEGEERGVIWYEIEPSLDHNPKKIEDAMREIEKHSRIKFKPRTPSQRCYLVITKDDGCYFNNENQCRPIISLGKGCRKFGTILHELLHAVGFEHEQSRPDRDRNVKILYENMETENKPQFNKVSAEAYKWNDFRFDWDSIMLYDSYAFSKNGLPTILGKEGQEIPRNTTLSELDKAKLNLV